MKLMARQKYVNNVQGDGQRYVSSGYLDLKSGDRLLKYSIAVLQQTKLAMKVVLTKI